MPLLMSSGLVGLEDGRRIPLPLSSGLVGRDGGLSIPLPLSSGLLGRDAGFSMPLPLSSGLVGREGGFRMPRPRSSAGLTGLEGGFRMPRVAASGLEGRDGRLGVFLTAPVSASGEEKVTPVGPADSDFRIPAAHIRVIRGTSHNRYSHVTECEYTVAKSSHIQHKG